MKDLDVYFPATPQAWDDLTVTHTGINIIQSTDYSPGGLVLQEEKNEPYRYGYQGPFAEMDSTTGWNHFEARQYDSRIMRWNSVDPSRQFYSSYLGMGNNPVSGVDPDGRDWFKDPDTGQPVWLGATSTFTDNAGVTWEHLSSSPAFMVVTHTRDAIGNELMNSATIAVFDALVNFFDPVGVIMGNTVPAGKANLEENNIEFELGPFNTIAEGVYPARDYPRPSKGLNDRSLILNNGEAIPTTSDSPRQYAYGIYLHWGNPYRNTLVSRSGKGRQFSEGCLTTGCGQGARTLHVQFFDQHLRGFHGDLWLRGR